MVALIACRLIANGSSQLGLWAAMVIALGVPGLAVANLTGIRARVSTPELFALVPVTGLAAWAPPFALAMLVHAPYRWVMVLVLVASSLTLSWDPRPMATRFPVEPVALIGGGLLFALVSSRYVPSLWGDALFHAGLIRKLLELPGLSLDSLSPYWNGHPHAGYAFPLLHGVQAAAINISGGDTSLDYQSLTPAFAFLVPIAAYGAGRSLANSPVALAAAVFACWDAMSRVAVLGLVKQPPYFTFLVIFPAVIVLLNLVYHDRDRRLWWIWTTIAAAEVALLHPTYSAMLVPLMLAVVVLRPRTWPVLAASVAVTVLVDVWIYLVAIHGGTHVTLYRGYPHMWIAFRGHDIATSGMMILAHRPEVVLGLVAAVVILFRSRSPWHLPAAMVATTLATIATPGAGVILTRAIAGGQIARFSKVPPAMLLTAIVLGIVATWLRKRPLLLGVTAIGLALGSYLLERFGFLWAQGTLHYPHHVETVRGVVWFFTGPDLLVVVLALIGIVALLVRAFDRDRSIRPMGPAPAMVAVVVLLAGVMVGPVIPDKTFVSDIIRHGSYMAPKTNELTPGLVNFFDDHAKTPFPVVLAPYWEPPDEGIAYQLVGRDTLYTVALPEDHTRATPRDHPASRRAQVMKFYYPGTSQRWRREMMRREHVDYVVFSKRTQPPAVLDQLRADPTLTQVYEDPPTVPKTSGEFVVFHRNGSDGRDSGQ